MALEVYRGKQLPLINFNKLYQKSLERPVFAYVDKIA